ncbi:MAG: hypothetical protein COA99_09230 [Moraxellaceae bacterium]|nr:MAG: hypothetical protein COA99_09230 [Moraxellaceae bacterium]
MGIQSNIREFVVNNMSDLELFFRMISLSPVLLLIVVLSRSAKKEKRYWFIISFLFAILGFLVTPIAIKVWH